MVSSPEMFLELDRSRRPGLRVQMEQGLREAIRSGRLVSGTLLPSSRALADDLGVSRGLVVTVYEQLTAEGYLVSRPGSGTVVSADVSQRCRLRIDLPTAAKAPYSFTPAHPDLSLFPRRAWARAFRSVWNTLPDEALGYGNPLGLPALREALADYLGRVRGLACEPGQVVVCGGFRHGFGLVAQALALLGHDSVALEDPGDMDLVPVIERWSLKAVPVAIDDEGLQVDRLEASGSRAVVVTPASQFPVGVVLSPTRRRMLCDWARRRDGYVLEDDCEGEFRHDRQPIGALQGVAPDRVVYFGTTWQSLAPGLRVAWVVIPQELTELLASPRVTPAATVSTVLQATFAEFLVRGDLDRHLRKVRKAYAHRREALLAALDRWLPEARTTGVAGGLHVPVVLPHGHDTGQVAADAAALGVDVRTLASFRSDGSPSPPGLVLGFARLTPSQIDEGIERLATAARRHIAHYPTEEWRP
jgi:GntR family transcriptional regulator/MocR family aminotransferase